MELIGTKTSWTALVTLLPLLALLLSEGASGLQPPLSSVQISDGSIDSGPWTAPTGDWVRPLEGDTVGQVDQYDAPSLFNCSSNNDKYNASSRGCLMGIILPQDDSEHLWVLPTGHQQQQNNSSTTFSYNNIRAVQVSRDDVNVTQLGQPWPKMLPLVHSPSEGNWGAAAYDAASKLIWLVPTLAGHPASLDAVTGVMHFCPTSWPAGFLTEGGEGKGKFSGAFFEPGGKHLWMIPSHSNMVVKMDTPCEESPTIFRSYSVNLVSVSHNKDCCNDEWGWNWCSNSAHWPEPRYRFQVYLTGDSQGSATTHTVDMGFQVACANDMKKPSWPATFASSSNTTKTGFTIKWFFWEDDCLPSGHYEPVCDDKIGEGTAIELFDDFVEGGASYTISSAHGYSATFSVIWNELPKPTVHHTTGFDSWPLNSIDTGNAFSRTGSSGGTMPSFAGGIFDPISHSAFLVPASATAVVQLNLTSGAMHAFDFWPPGYALGVGSNDSTTNTSLKFYRGCYEGNVTTTSPSFVWLAPYNVNMIVKVDTVNGSMAGFGAWPVALALGVDHFATAAFDGKYVWFPPMDASHLIRLDPRTGDMTAFGIGPTLSSGIISSALDFTTDDTTSLWLTPRNASEPLRRLRFTTATHSQSVTRSQSSSLSSILTRSQSGTNSRSHNSATPSVTTSSTRTMTTTESASASHPTPTSSETASGGSHSRTQTATRTEGKTESLLTETQTKPTRTATHTESKTGSPFTQTRTATTETTATCTKTPSVDLVGPLCESLGPRRGGSFDFLRNNSFITVVSRNDAPEGGPLVSQTNTDRTQDAVPVLQGAAFTDSKFAVLGSLTFKMDFNLPLINTTTAGGSTTRNTTANLVDLVLAHEERSGDTFPVTQALATTVVGGRRGESELLVTLAYSTPSNGGKHDRKISVVVHRDAFLCGEELLPSVATLPGGFNFTLIIKGEEGPWIDPGVQKVVTQVTIPSSVASAVLMHPSQGMHQLRMTSLVMLSVCFFAHDQPLPLMVSPTGFGFGSSHGRYYRGGLIGNLLLLIGLGLFFLLLASVIFAARRNQGVKIPTSDGTFSGDFSDALATTHMPSVIVIPIVLGFQGTVAMATALFVHSTTAGDVTLAVFGGLVCFVILGFVALVSTKFFRLKLEPRVEKQNLGRKRRKKQRAALDDSEHGPVGSMREPVRGKGILQKIGMIFESEYHWVDPEPRTKWKRRYLFFFYDYKLSWFFLIELSSSFLLGIIDGIRMSNLLVCIAMSAVMLLLFLAILVLALALKPSLTPFQQGALLILNFLSFVAALALLIGLTTENPDALHTTGVIGFVVNILGTLKFMLDVAAGILWAYRTNYLKKMRRSMQQTFIPSGGDVTNLRDLVSDDDNDGNEGGDVSMVSLPQAPAFLSSRPSGEGPRGEADEDDVDPFAGLDWEDEGGGDAASSAGALRQSFAASSRGSAGGGGAGGRRLAAADSDDCLSLGSLEDVLMAEGANEDRQPRWEPSPATRSLKGSFGGLFSSRISSAGSALDEKEKLEARPPVTANPLAAGFKGIPTFSRPPPPTTAAGRGGVSGGVPKQPNRPESVLVLVQPEVGAATTTSNRKDDRGLSVTATETEKARSVKEQLEYDAL